MPTTLRNTLDFRCAPDALYAYVTQPWRWHEWHPNSRSATASVEILSPGDTFDEVIEIQPFSPLPITLRRQTHYRVLVAEPHRRWQARGETRDGWLEIDYDFEPIDTGTRFTRTLRYQTSGASLLLMPLLRQRMTVMSRRALLALRERVEQDASISASGRRH